MKTACGLARLHSLLLCSAVFLCAGCGGNHANGENDDQPGAATLPVITTKSGIKMVQVPAGSFNMGSMRGRDDEKPVHKVWVDSFFIDICEVKQADFERIGRAEAMPNPSQRQGPELPVEKVKMHEAALFCNARSTLEGLDCCYIENDKKDDFSCNFDKNGYRLPTEAEWEYACRAGTDTDFSFGNNDRQLGEHGWYAENCKETHPVGQKKPNAWGIFDMHGNVAEWCHDIYAKDYYQNSPEKNPRGPKTGKEYVLRGGCWKTSAVTARSAYRVGENPGFVDACTAPDAIGFRCVRKAP